MEKIMIGKKEGKEERQDGCMKEAKGKGEENNKIDNPTNCS